MCTPGGRACFSGIELKGNRGEAFMSATTTNTERLRFKTAPRHFLAHLATMPRWHKLVLLLGVGLAIAGGIGWMTSRAASDRGTRVTSTSSSTSVPAPAGSSKFIDGGTPSSD